MTGQRRVIARVLSAETDHPDLERSIGAANFAVPNIAVDRDRT